VFGGAAVGLALGSGSGVAEGVGVGAGPGRPRTGVGVGTGLADGVGAGTPPPASGVGSGWVGDCSDPHAHRTRQAAVAATAPTPAHVLGFRLTRSRSHEGHPPVKDVPHHSYLSTSTAPQTSSSVHAS
jgi:hypothetical protein